MINDNNEIESKDNFPLDLLRTLSVLSIAIMPTIINMFSLHEFHGGYIGDSIFSYIIIVSAPALLFFVSGVASLRLALIKNKWKLIREVGILGLLYQGALYRFSFHELDFLMFLYLLFIVTFYFRRLLSYVSPRIIVLIGILGISFFMSTFLMSTKHLRELYEFPSQLAPWAFFFMLGMVVDNRANNFKNRIFVIGCGIILILYSFLIRYPSAQSRIKDPYFFHHYLHPTSILLLIGGILLCLYCLFGFIRIKSNSAFRKIATLFSENVYQGIVFQPYTKIILGLLIELISVLFWSLDISLMDSLRPILIIPALYIVLIILVRLRHYLAAKIGERSLYNSGLYLGIIASIASIFLLSIPDPHQARIIFLGVSFCTLPYIAFAFIHITTNAAEG